MTSETKLRFFLDPRDFAGVARARGFGKFKADKPVTERMVSYYYDTEKLRLAKAGWTLRVRLEGGRFVQTVKSEGTDAAGTGGGEYECAVESEDPDTGLVPDAAVREALSKMTDGKTLARVLTAGIFRTARRLRAGNDGEIEMALDEGEIRTLIGKDASLPVESLELALKRGSPSLLFDAARMLADKTVLLVDAESEGRKGLRAIAGDTARAAKAARMKLNRDAATEDAFAASLAHCLTHIGRNAGALARTYDEEGVHHLRVGMRRLRAALAAPGKPFRDRACEDLRERAKAFAASLAGARDLDAFAKDILAPVEAAAEPLQGIRMALSSARRRAQGQAVRIVRSTNFRFFLIDLAAFLHLRLWREGASAQIPAYFSQPARRTAALSLKKLLAKARRSALDLDRLDTEERHELRIALKKLRYTAEFFAPLFGKARVAPYLADLSKLQDQFGALNDAANAESILSRLAPFARGKDKAEFEAACKTVAEWHRLRAPGLWAKARKRWKHFAKRKPFWL